MSFKRLDDVNKNKPSRGDLRVEWLHAFSSDSSRFERPNKALFASLTSRGSPPSVRSPAASGPPPRVGWKHLWNERKRRDDGIKKDDGGMQEMKSGATQEEGVTWPLLQLTAGGVRQTKEPVGMHVKACTCTHTTTGNCGQINLSGRGCGWGNGFFFFRSS